MAAPITKQKEEQISIVLERRDFPKTMYFNRYFLQKIEDNELVAHFGLMTTFGAIAEYSCMLLKRVVESHRDQTLSYLGKLPEVAIPKDVYFRPVREFDSLDVPLVFVAGHSQDLGEISFYDFPLRQVRETPVAFPKCLLRSAIGIHKKFLEELFVPYESPQR